MNGESQSARPVYPDRDATVSALINKECYSFDDLRAIMALLRCEGGCPWDMEQDHHSIRRDFIEETYEAVEAIDNEDPVHLREELGDVLLQVMFHARIEEEAGTFDIGGVIDGICKKLIFRHPHVFGDVSVANSAQVLENWDKLKGIEKSRERVTRADKLRAIPAMEPALMRAQKVGKKASCFDFPDKEAVIGKLYEEIDEVREADKSGDENRVSEEMGDLLLTVTSLSRFLHVDSELALTRATDKFINRFDRLEREVISRGYADMDELTQEQLDGIWDEIKHAGEAAPATENNREA